MMVFQNRVLSRIFGAHRQEQQDKESCTLMGAGAVKVIRTYDTSKQLFQ